ncbi:unnamed protein product, partial [Ixodes hexagonus]
MARDRKADDQSDFIMDDAEAEEAVGASTLTVGCCGGRQSSGLVGRYKQLRVRAAGSRSGDREDGGAIASR